MEITPEDVKRAQARIASQIVETPSALSRTLSAQLGCELYIKFENLQFTASFKERGALNCLLSHQDEISAGVIAMSAGNHAQALAYHGQAMGLPVTIVMPRFTPNAKVEATRVFGAEVILHGNEFDETKSYTEQLAAERGLFLVHPYDDADVIAGSGCGGRAGWRWRAHRGGGYRDQSCATADRGDWRPNGPIPWRVRRVPRCVE